MTDHPAEYYASPDLTSIPPTRITPVHSDRVEGEKRRLRLGEALVEAGVITQQQLEACLREQQKDTGTRRRLGAIIVERSLATEADIAQGLAAMLGFEFVDLFLVTPDPLAVRRLPRHVAEQLGVIPLAAGASWLRIAVSDPTDNAAIGTVREAAGVQAVSVALSTPGGIKGALVRAWEGPEPVPAEPIASPDPAAALPAESPKPAPAAPPATVAATAPPQDPWEGLRWEYFFIGDGMPMEHPGYVRNEKELDARLAELGMQGWEAIGLNANMTRNRVLLRRPLRD